MKFTSFSEVNIFLQEFSPGRITNPGVYTLDRMKKLMPIIGTPQEKIKIVHVAGTSGKTSTAYYISNLLSKTGKKVGLCVSPHIYQINERVQVNNTPLEESEFCRLFTEFINVRGVIELNPSYFELLVAFAFWSFHKLACDYAVIEVGLGGLIDGTNVIDNPEKISVITDIGLDHTRILGETIEEIAHQKAGIIHAGNRVFMYIQTPEILSVVTAQVRKVQAELHVSDEKKLRETSRFIDGLPDYQKRNWLLAKEVFSYICDRDDISSISDIALIESQNLQVPARMQTVNYHGKKIILDGAHNPQKLRAFADSIRLKYPESRIALLVSFSAAKTEAINNNLQILHELSNDIIVTSFQLQEDLPHESISLEVLKEAAELNGFDAAVEMDNKEAFALLCSRDVDLYIITGSFYLIAAMYDTILNEIVS